MSSVVGFTVFGVDWTFLKPYIVFGLALGGVYALSGVGIVVLYRATGVLNLAFGAVGAAGALIAYWMINHTSWPNWLAYATLHRVRRGRQPPLRSGLRPRLRATGPAREDDGNARLALILLGLMAWRAPAGGAFVRVLTLPTTTHRYELFGAVVNLTQILALAFARRAHGRDDRVPPLHEARHRLSRALANDREITATLGVPVRRVEASAWLGSGLVCGTAGLLLADLYTSLDYAALTFLVISSLAAALIGRLQSLWVTLRRRPHCRPRPGRC